MALVLWPFTFLFLLWGVVSRHLHNDLHICQLTPRWKARRRRGCGLTTGNQAESKTTGSHLHTYRTCMGVMTLFVHAPSDKAILALDEHMTSVCKAEGESPVAVVPRSLSWKMGIWIWETGLDGSSEGKDHCWNVQHTICLWPPVNSEISSRMINNLMSKSSTLAMFGISLILLYQNT